MSDSQTSEPGPSTSASLKVSTRLARELNMFARSPRHDISCILREGTRNVLDALIIGCKDTMYEHDAFELEIQIPDRYPFQPPTVMFKNKVEHPNIDNEGFVRLTILQMPPEGGWTCTMTLEQTLGSIQAMLTQPQIDDYEKPDLVTPGCSTSGNYKDTCYQDISDSTIEESKSASKFGEHLDIGNSGEGSDKAGAGGKKSSGSLRGIFSPGSKFTETPLSQFADKSSLPEKAEEIPQEVLDADGGIYHASTTMTNTYICSKQGITTSDCEQAPPRQKRRMSP